MLSPERCGCTHCCADRQASEGQARGEGRARAGARGRLLPRALALPRLCPSLASPCGSDPLRLAGSPQAAGALPSRSPARRLAQRLPGARSPGAGAPLLLSGSPGTPLPSAAAAPLEALPGGAALDHLASLSESAPPSPAPQRRGGRVSALGCHQQAWTQLPRKRFQRSFCGTGKERR